VQPKISSLIPNLISNLIGAVDTGIQAIFAEIFFFADSGDLFFVADSGDRLSQAIIAEIISNLISNLIGAV
jgi:hypothetical protein